MPTIKAAARRQSALGVSTVECREPRMEYNDIHSEDGQRRGSPRGVKSKREAAAVAVACHINVCFKRAGGALPPKRCFLQGISKNKMFSTKRLSVKQCSSSLMCQAVAIGHLFKRICKA